jgi:hypothetical protein
MTIAHNIMRMCALSKTAPVAFPLDAEYIAMRYDVRKSFREEKDDGT